MDSKNRTELIVVSFCLILAPLLDSQIGSWLSPGLGQSPMAFGGLAGRLGLIALLIYLSPRQGVRYKPDLASTARAIGTLLFLGLIAWILGTGIASGTNADAATSNPAVYNALAGRGNNPALVSLVFLTLIFAAVQEEALYRLWFIERAQSLGMAPILSIFLQAILFTPGHFYQGLGASLLALCSGLVLGYVYQRWRSFWTVALAHLLFNCLVAAWYLWGLKP